MPNFWGFHSLWDLRKSQTNIIFDKDLIKQFVDDLILKIDMVAYGPLWAERFATHDLDKAGFSFFQMIETSNISGHLCDSTRDAYIDIFSCKPYDLEITEQVIKKHFNPVFITMRNIYRQA